MAARPAMKCVASTDDIGRYSRTHFYKDVHQTNIEEKKKYNLRVVTGRANKNLAMDVCKLLGVGISEVNISQAACHEMSVNFSAGINGDDVYVIQPMCCGDDGTDLNTSVMELLLMVHALKLNGAARVTGIVPYIAYSRQDRKTKPRVPISASAVCQLVQSMGVDRVLTVDLHCGQIQGFFHNTPVDNLPTHHEFSRYALETIVPREGVKCTSEELTIVAPDANGVERARMLANLTDAKGVVSILRRTLSTGELKLEMVGDVQGQVCIVIDDLIDTGKTMLNAVRMVAEKGARAVYGVATHGLLTSPAIENINSCTHLRQLIITDTVNIEDKQSLCPKLHVITIAPMLAASIERTHREESLNALFVRR